MIDLDEKSIDGRSLQELIVRQFGDWSVLKAVSPQQIQVEWDYKKEGLGVYRGRVFYEGEYPKDYVVDYEVDPPPERNRVIPLVILNAMGDRCKETIAQNWRRWHRSGSVEYIGISSRGVLYLEVVEEDALMSVAISESGRMSSAPVARREMDANLYYVDVPVKDNDGNWASVREFGSFAEASEFVQDEFGATADGWVCLITAGQAFEEAEEEDEDD